MVVAAYIDMRALGERVLVLRRRGNCSQHELAKKAGVDVMTVSRLERGTKKRLEVEQLARAYTAGRDAQDDLCGPC
jgi:transcriptional regulator with XRE-family HTH domain